MKRGGVIGVSAWLVGGLVLVLLGTGCGAQRGRGQSAAGEVGVASWYGPGFHGRPTASGERYDQHQLTAAHQTLPLGTWIEVTRLDNGRRVTVRVNDRGPFVGGRIVDLSRAAAEQLQMVEDGVAEVRLVVTRAVAGARGSGGSSGFTVQVGAFVEPGRAQRLRDRLAADFDHVRIVPFAHERERFHRVRLGRYPERAAAERMAGRVRRLGLPAVVLPLE
jgi:rare lipoprotein A